MSVSPGEDDGSSHQEEERAGAPVGDERAKWRAEPSDADVDAAFAAIVSSFLDDGIQRHPSAGGPTHDTGEERARRRELRRLERAEEVAAFAAHQAEIEAEREADDAHFTPPEPPPLPRPKGRTIGAALMILAGIALLARPGLLAVGPDLALVLAVVLILAGASILLTGIWRRRGGGDGDGWDDGAVV